MEILEDLSEKSALKFRPKMWKEASHWKAWRKVFQAESMASAKALRQEIQVCSEKRKQTKVPGREWAEGRAEEIREGDPGLILKGKST